jgi:hypothetical protein
MSRRVIRLLVLASALLAAGPARAQVNLAVTPSAAATAPLVNAVTHGAASSFYLDVANSKGSTNLRQIEFRLPLGWVAQGGGAPEGWTVTRLQTNGFYAVRFQIADCSATAVGGITSGKTGTFRLDVTPPTSAVAGDWSDTLARIAVADPCGGTTGWNVTSASAVAIPVKALAVTGTVAPAQGPVGIATTSTWTVTNLSSAARTVTPSVMVTPQGGSAVACGPVSPATVSLAPAGAAGASATFTCARTLSTAGVYTFAATASGAGASAVGATAGSARAGGVTATFAFTTLTAGPADQVQAEMTFQNNTASAATVTPPRYSQLTLAALGQSPGTKDPSDVTVAAGQSGSATYTFDVSGAVGAAYRAQGTPTVSPAGTTTNLAITPPGTVTPSTVSWSPPGIVSSRTPTGPWTFTVTVVNNGAAPIGDISVVNPQPGLWGGLTYVGMSPAGSYKVSGTPTDTIKYTVTLPSKGTATLQFSFSTIPAVTQTTAYPFHVKTVSTGPRSVTTTYDDTLAIVPAPIPDVANLTILSDASGQVLAWTNRDGGGATQHDGIAIFRTPAGADPFVPADFVDYSDPAKQVIGAGIVLYADRDRSAARTFADPVVGAYNYRVCNHDALFVYSSCTSGFWTGKGYLDSVVAPAGGWTHQLGGTSLIQPGLLPGSRVAVATNRPDITVLDLATGLRTFDPVALGSLPAGNTPAATMANGRRMLFAADAQGLALGFDLDAGTTTWQATKPGEVFLSEITGIVKQYAHPSYTAPFDTILLASKTGRVLGVRYDTGATVWTLQVGGAGQGLYAAPVYDPGTNRLFVAVDGGGGVRAYDVGAGAAAPAAVAGWPATGGSYTIPCSPGPLTTDLACVDTAGSLVVLDTGTGAPRAGTVQVLANATALRTVFGTAHGYVVSSAAAVQRVALSTSSVLSVAAQWTAPAGVTLSSAQAFPADGTVFVAASDKKLRKLSFDALAPLAALDIPGPLSSVLVGPPVFDRANARFVFATSKGRVFAIPAF